MSFVDETTIHVKAGRGGNGCVSFRREKYVPRGGPDGGDGANAGSVILVATKKMLSLADFHYRSHFKAENGGHGQGRNCSGRRGADCIIQVPVGTIVRDREGTMLFADLDHDGAPFVAAKGGKGGRGNARFATSTNRAPRRCEKGSEGEERWLALELRLMADVGLVGLPNAGKSTLLSQLSAAHPKIAPYPFTTLTPQLGVMLTPDHPPLVIADLPGLIQDASLGAGLGFAFLRHAERTGMLVHVVDIQGSDERGPWEDFCLINHELEAYDLDILKKKRLVILNKCDLVDEKKQNALSNFFVQKGYQVLCVSALDGTGIEILQKRLLELRPQPQSTLSEAIIPESDDD